MKKLITWDTNDIIECEVEFRMEDGQLTKDEVRKDVYQDSDLFTFAWDDLTDYLTELMNKRVCWKVTVNDYGWRSLDGKKYIKADTGKKLLNEILPDTDCMFYIFKYRNGFAIQNYHHDSPTGKEWYYVVPIAESTYYKFN